MSVLYKGQSLRHRNAIFPALVAAAALAILVSLAGIAGMAGRLPDMPAGGVKRTLDHGCKGCGVVESIQQRRVDSRHPVAIWQTRIRFDNGEVRTFDHRSDPEWHIGDRVRIDPDRFVVDQKA